MVEQQLPLSETRDWRIPDPSQLALARTSDPDTSHMAAHAVAPGVGALERAILDQASIDYPFTAFALADMVEQFHPGRWSEGTIRTRVSSMGKRGLLVRIEKWAVSPRGQMCDGWSKP